MALLTQLIEKVVSVHTQKEKEKERKKREAAVKEASPFNNTKGYLHSYPTYLCLKILLHNYYNVLQR